MAGNESKKLVSSDKSDPQKSDISVAVHPLQQYVVEPVVEADPELWRA